MKYQVEPSKEAPGDYVAVAINEDSRAEIFSALFSGPEAKQRAEEYAAWKNRQLEVTGEQLLKR
jgi:hypothetical protein